MSALRSILEFIIVTLVFYALYEVSLFIHERFYPHEDPAWFILISFLTAFFLIGLYRFSLRHHTKRELREKMRMKEAKERERREALLQKEAEGKEENVPSPEESEQEGEETEMNPLTQEKGEPKEM